MLRLDDFFTHRLLGLHKFSLETGILVEPYFRVEFRQIVIPFSRKLL